MSVGTVAALPHKGRYAPRLTSQQVADLMLRTDQDRRMAAHRRELDRVAELEAELDQLQRLLP